MNSKLGRSARIFFILILLINLISVAKIFCPAVQKVFLRQFHLVNRPFVVWAMLQPIPSMYSFSNELWYSTQPLDLNTTSLDEVSGSGIRHLYLNHYPLRFVTFNLYRQFFTMGDGEHFVYLRSRYQNTQQLTAYRILFDGEKILIQSL